MRGPQPWRTTRSRNLRINQTSAERKIWNALRNRQLAGHKFIRQAAIGPFFVDLVCRDERVIVEIDGDTHITDAEIEGDAARTEHLLTLGYRVFRAHNTEFMKTWTAS